MIPLAGSLSLIGIGTGAFDIGDVQVTLILAGNPSSTLHNILAHETLFRLGFAAHLFELVLNIFDEIIFFNLFRRVNGSHPSFGVGEGGGTLMVEMRILALFLWIRWEAASLYCLRKFVGELSESLTFLIVLPSFCTRFCSSVY
jgi:hypothetical protein